MSEYTTQAHTFSPVYTERSKVFILGSFPSVKSREEQFYYGHPQNRFWKLISSLMKEEEPKTISEKIHLLEEHDLALWDVIRSCEIIGSSDSSIRNVVPNDINKVLQNTAIQRIYANGNTAAKLYKKYIQSTTGIEIVTLPSTSPANASYSLERLQEAWKVIITE